MNNSFPMIFIWRVCLFTRFFFLFARWLSLYSNTGKIKVKEDTMEERGVEAVDIGDRDNKDDEEDGMIFQ